MGIRDRYYTVKDVENSPSHFVARQLFDKDYEVDLGETKFVYQDKEYIVMDVKFNYRLDRAILATNIVSEFRHSSKGFYWIKNLETNEIVPLNPGNEEELVTLSYAHFSPSNNFVYFVHANDLFYKHLYSDAQPVQITNDGSSNILNAKPDWVYEEEVLASEKAIWWSPDDSKFIFAKFDITAVPDYELSLIHI